MEGSMDPTLSTSVFPSLRASSLPSRNMQPVPTGVSSQKPLPWTRVLTDNPNPNPSLFAVSAIPTPEDIIPFAHEDVVEASSEWNMALVGYSLGKRPFYGSLLAAVDATATYPEFIPIPVEGKIFNLKILYEWKPIPCEHCSSLIHVNFECPNNPNPQTLAQKPIIPPRGRSSSRKPKENIGVQNGILSNPDEQRVIPEVSIIGSHKVPLIIPNIPNLNGPNEELSSSESSNPPTQVSPPLKAKSPVVQSLNKFSVLQDNSDLDLDPEVQINQVREPQTNLTFGIQSSVLNSLPSTSTQTASQGPIEKDERISLWEDIRRINPLNNLPWIVAGDFNCCRFISEKAGGNPLSVDRMGHFNTLIFDTALTDLTSTGIFFTWNNQRSDNPISIKLDRSLVNEKWIATFPNSYYKVLSASISDHLPLIIYSGEHIKKIHRFLFKNHWTRYQNFWEVLLDVFATHYEGNPISQFYNKLRKLKKHIKGANWNSSNSISSSIDSLTQQQLDCQTLLDFDPLNPELRNNLKIINSKLMFYNSIWSTWVKQRAKVKWLKNGEEDLKFLYSRIHRRKAVNTSSSENALFGHSGDRNSKIQEIIDHFKVLVNHNNYASADESNFPTGSSFPIHLTEALIKPVTFEEVKNVVLAGHSDSAPGPDGYNFDFYKKCWHIIGNDVFRAVQSFFLKNYLPVGAKPTALVLIPKNKHACSIDDFRPIALLATDNPILADEIMKMFNNTRREYLCAKFDIKKAFNTVSRYFLISRMTQKGFPNVFTNWIKTCITNVNFFICLNGSLEGFFPSSTGLRQGCPVSPYLFCILMDSFSCLIDEHANMRNFKGISVGDFHISHLLYADDLIVFGEANNSNCSNLIDILDYFFACSGLYTNNQKSSVSFSQHTPNIMELAHILKIPNVTNKFNYLGIPISTGKDNFSTYWLES
ncbi:uncharacterized protein LOC110109801 [Dendrobium catenatum]|uniref:uncharacterized protein LOC110109801 n=1 Tax=Dendrobium catenatum TaxID=906689 RepID=UPI00109FDED7|nr:uncharacterized protein LOC110109801 [Dendrobium catenatum]